MNHCLLGVQQFSSSADVAEHAPQLTILGQHIDWASCSNEVVLEVKTAISHILRAYGMEVTPSELKGRISYDILGYASAMAAGIELLTQQRDGTFARNYMFSANGGTCLKPELGMIVVTYYRNRSGQITIKTYAPGRLKAGQTETKSAMKV